MYKNIIKKSFLGFMILFGLLFVNLDEVRAMGKADGNGYSECYYNWDVSPDMPGVGQQTKRFMVAITVFKDTNSHYNGYAIAGCGSNTITIDNIRTFNCSIVNHDDVFNEVNSEMIGNKFRPNLTGQNAGKWSCPVIWVKSDIMSNYVYIYLKDAPPGAKKISGNKIHNKSKQTGEPILNDSDVNRVTKDSINAVNRGEADDYEYSGPNNDIVAIQCWANPSLDICGGNNTGTSNRSCQVIDGKYYDAEGDVTDETTYIQECYTSDCNLIPSDILDFLKKFLFIIQVIGILLLIMMSFVEFIKALTGSDDEGLMKAVKNTGKRIIVVVILLLLPVIIVGILNMINNEGYQKDENGNLIIGEEGNPLCNLDK